ncbi:hypothetical protein [Hyphomicrobium sp.]|uniref:hypothetical protein n=1 Tax=Hyphomicrobium sp. TaxID=82 RepID=UPI00356AC94D
MEWRYPIKDRTDLEYKARYHSEVKQRLTQFATALGFKDQDYDLRSIKGYDDSSGLIFLTHDELYVSVGQDAFAGWEIKIYFSERRGDRSPTPRLELPIELLDNIPLLVLIANDHLNHKRNLKALQASGPLPS